MWNITRFSDNTTFFTPIIIHLPCLSILLLLLLLLPLPSSCSSSYRHFQREFQSVLQEMSRICGGQVNIYTSLFIKGVICGCSGRYGTTVTKPQSRYFPFFLQFQDVLLYNNIIVLRKRCDENSWNFICFTWCIKTLYLDYQTLLFIGCYCSLYIGGASFKLQKEVGKNLKVIS